ncbi:MAG: hypothetical protein R3E32_09260 [Chitinophagales bacterium]
MKYLFIIKILLLFFCLNIFGQNESINIKNYRVSLSDTSHCDFQPICCDYIDEYEGLNDCEKVDYLEKLYPKKKYKNKEFKTKLKNCFSLQAYVLKDVVHITGHFSGSAGKIGRYYTNLELFYNDLRKWRCILGCE